MVLEVKGFSKPVSSGKTWYNFHEAASISKGMSQVRFQLVLIQFDQRIRMKCQILEYRTRLTLEEKNLRNLKSFKMQTGCELGSSRKMHLQTSGWVRKVVSDNGLFVGSALVCYQLQSLPGSSLVPVRATKTLT